MNDNGNPKAFKDCLRQLVEANGGMSSDSLRRLAEDIRKIAPSLSIQRLNGLLQGQPPNTSERHAISQTLEPVQDRWLSDYWLLEDADSRQIAEFAAARTKSHEAVKEFVEFVSREAHYRYDSLSVEDLSKAYAEFDGEPRRLEVEMALFGLVA